MFIQTEVTPNPATLKFVPGEPVMARGTAFFESVEEAANSPLGQRLFAIEGVSNIFFGSDFVAVTLEGQDWDDKKTDVLGAIMEHYTSGEPVVAEETAAAPAAAEEDGEHAEIIAQIKELLEARVRPAVARDGGDITFHSFEEGVVYLRMQGACSGCPSSTATLQYGVQNLLKHYIPEIESVQAI
ncbi:NifU family protein [Paremcibacter congregatus]|uniref:NifU family protein n=1 Tax=Paremcibacter congregatus TaxID=2043170 RepID=UPI0030EE6D78|tara:strand:+ start:19357 stop:19911 length:555 start_codon:yes stop_codon:yes gene_type:complete